MDPLHAYRRRAQRLDTAFPHLRFPLALLSLALGFSLRRWLTQEGLLLRNPQHFATLRQHRQHGLQQEALMAPAADGTQARGRGMRVIVQVGRVLDQQHLRLLTSRFPRLLQMRADQLAQRVGALGILDLGALGRGAVVSRLGLRRGLRRRQAECARSDS